MATTDSPLNEIPPQLQGVIQLALSAFIKQNLNEIYIMIAASLWLGVSFSLFIALLYSSTTESRRTPLFWFSFIAVGFGTIPSVLFLRLLVQSFAKALEITAEFIKPYISALGFFSYFSSICVDCILLLRIAAVFPPSRMSPKQIARVFGPLLVLKLARIATVIALVIHYIRHSKNVGLDNTEELYTAATQLPEPKAAWVLQLVDNAVCSSLFLYELHRIQSLSIRHISFLRRLQTLFLIAVSNFVFPVIFVIIQLIFMTRALSVLAVACLNISGVNIEVIGVLFATIWSAQLRANSWTYVEGDVSNETMTHEINFRRPTDTDLESGHHHQISTLGTTATDSDPSEIITPGATDIKEREDSASKLREKDGAKVVFANVI